MSYVYIDLQLKIAEVFFAIISLIICFRDLVPLMTTSTFLFRNITSEVTMIIKFCKHLQELSSFKSSNLKDHLKIHSKQLQKEFEKPFEPKFIEHVVIEQTVEDLI